MKILRGLLLVLLLSACQSSMIANLVTQPGEALYHDDFSDPGSGWPQTVNANGSLGYANGAYRVLVQSTGYSLWAVSGQSYGDASVQADAARLAGPVSNRFGLICRYQDANNFYMFIISSDGYYAIGKIRNGKASLPGQAMMTYSSFIKQNGAAAHLRFDCVGNTLTGAVNGQPIVLIHDADLADGEAGLIAGTFDEGGADIAFDNFVVYKP